MQVAVKQFQHVAFLPPDNQLLCSITKLVFSSKSQTGITQCLLHVTNHTHAKCAGSGLAFYTNCVM